MISLAAAVGITRSILVLVAMEVEERAILAEKKWVTIPVSQKMGITAKNLTVGKNSVSVLRTGVGPVNAGMNIALFAEKYPVTEIIVLGVGGALSRSVVAGDTVLATGVLQHDSIISYENGTELMAPGELFLSIKPEQRLPPEIKTDPALSERVKKYLKKDPHFGVILSGNEFVGSTLRKRELHTEFPKALIVEMECAGVAQLARKLGIPFAVAKTVADEAAPKASMATDYLHWLESSAKKAEQVIHALTVEIGVP